MTPQGLDVADVAGRLRLLDEVFLPSAPIHTDELLAGRTTQRGRLVEVASTKGGHAAIYGGRGVGKTSVAAVFEADSRNRGEFVVRVNCAEGSSVADLKYDISIAIQDLLDDEWAAWVAERLTRDASQADVVRVLLRVSEQTRLIIILDEFDLVDSAGVAKDVANLMKALADKQADAHLVVVGVAADVNAIMNGHASIARGLAHVEMPPLENDELRKILDLAADKLEISFPEHLQRRVVRLSNRLPHYTHLLGKELARKAIMAERSEVRDEDWGPALAEAVARAEQGLLQLHAQATTSAKQSNFESLLLAAALAEKDKQGFFRPVDVHPHLNRIDGKTYAMKSFTGNLAKMATDARGPVLESKTFADGRKRYRFVNPLMQPYVLLRATEEGRIKAAELDDDSVWGGAA